MGRKKGSFVVNKSPEERRLKQDHGHSFLKQSNCSNLKPKSFFAGNKKLVKMSGGFALKTD